MLGLKGRQQCRPLQVLLGPAVSLGAEALQECGHLLHFFGVIASEIVLFAQVFREVEKFRSAGQFLVTDLAQVW